MRNNLLLFVLLFVAAFITNAQTTTTTGIAIQGISRDDIGVAKDSQTISLMFEIYYNTTIILSHTVDLETDSNGVFSEVIPALTHEQRIKIANNVAKLRITDIGYAGVTDDILVSDEVLDYVPYAVAAYNGVPTGTIMPYAGETAPPGWLLCDGTVIPLKYTALRALLPINDAGDKVTPYLIDQFLSGAVAPSQLNDTIPQALPWHNHTLTINDHVLKAHDHNINSNNNFVLEGISAWTLYYPIVSTDSNPAYVPRGFLTTKEVVYDINGVRGTDNRLPDTYYKTASGAASLPPHAFSLTKKSGNTGFGTVVRPASYAVNYIIKL